jgi:hypothetical protein
VRIFPTHTDGVPVIVPATGNGLTVTFVVAKQPVAVVYLIVAAPAVMPVRNPVLALIVAVVLLLLLHVPPVVALASVAVSPAHSTTVPVIGVDNVLTVTTFVAKHPGVVV